MTHAALLLAEKEIGTWEWKDGHNPKILAYFKDAGHPQIKDDETAWCAAFVGAMLKRSGSQGTGSLVARSYLNWGEPVDLADAKPGDIVVFARGNSTWQGHVGFFVKRQGAFIEVLGGNQSNQVNIQRYSTANLLGVRREKLSLPQTPAAPEPFNLIQWLIDAIGRLLKGK